MSRKAPVGGAGTSGDRAAQDAVVQAVTRALDAFPDGVPVEELVTRLGAPYDADAVLQLVNALSTKKRLVILRGGDGTVHVRPAGAAETKLRGLSTEELMVFHVIRDAGNTGVWTRDMKARTNLAQPQITKVLKGLETRQLVKSVKSVTNPSRKLYMLAELEPSKEVTGGAWYTDNNFDSEFIKVLQRTIARYIQEHGDVTLGQVHAFVAKTGLSKVQLALEDIRCLVDTLVCDMRVEDFEEEDDTHYRPHSLPLPERTPATEVPCGVCPVLLQCKDGGPISPQTCEYYQAWLKIEF